jgi:hypothetical protein
MHIRIFQTDLVIIFQFLKAATRKMATCNAMVNARNEMNTWQTIRRLNRLFCGRRILSTNAKPPSGNFTMPVLCSLPYVHKRLKMQLPSMFRREISHNAHYSLQNSQRHIELQILSKQIQAERRLKDVAMHFKERERVRKSSGKRGSQVMFERRRQQQQ